jgi:cysteine-S-conjugate beta-lyase
MALNWRSKLIHPQVAAPEGFRSLVTPTYRGSTTLLDSATNITDDWDQKRARYSYGLYGTPTTFELAARIADLEGGGECFIVPGGQAAIGLVYLACAGAGGHVLAPDNVYGPSRDLSQRVLAKLGIQTEFYDPMMGADIRKLIRPNTQLIWCESPGSVTMEVQDVPAITAVARELGVPTALDNTYAAGVYFDAFAHGIDITMQALTKYIGGHSDLLLGSVTVRDEKLYQALGDARQLLGLSGSPDDCSLALRGLQTLAVRLKHLEQSTLLIAQWLAEQPEIELLLHPAFPSCPGHEFWKRDFTGSSSVFSVVFAPNITREAITRFADALELFKLGYSWGGVTSLVIPRFGMTRQHRSYGDRLVRLNVGLEDPQDLIADLTQGLNTLRSSS